MKQVLELDGVYANIGQFQILQGVSFRVPENQVTVLMGRNGAGKTTTLRTIMGYVRPRVGHIRMNDAVISDLSTHEIRSAWHRVSTRGQPRFPPFDGRRKPADGR